MNETIKCVALSLFVAIRLFGEVPPAILTVTSTNILSIWEGNFVFRDIRAVPLEGNETVYLAIYSNATPAAARYDARLDGTLIELYKEANDGQAVRLLTAGEDKWGCAPHILAFGNILPATGRYWTIWRDPDYSAHLEYERYSYTNSVFELTDRLVFTGIKPNLFWKRYENGQLSDTPPLDFSNHHIIWLNTNTLYKLEAYNFNFPEGTFPEQPSLQ